MDARVKVFIGDTYSFGRARDISAGGMRIESRIAPSVGQSVRLGVEMPDRQWAAIEGELVHAVWSPETNGWSWGVKFCRFPLGHRLRSHLPNPTERVPAPVERAPSPVSEHGPASAKRYVSDNHALLALYKETMTAIRARLEGASLPASRRRG